MASQCLLSKYHSKISPCTTTKLQTKVPERKAKIRKWNDDYVPVRFTKVRWSRLCTMFALLVRDVKYIFISEARLFKLSSVGHGLSESQSKGPRVRKG